MNIGKYWCVFKITSFWYNGEYWQNWKLHDCQHTFPDEMRIEQQVSNTNLGQKTSPDEIESEWQVPKTNIRQKTLLFYSDGEHSNTNIRQKTSLFHSDGEYSIDVLKVLSSLKINQLYQRMMMLQSVYQLHENLNTWLKERMKDMTWPYLLTLTLLLLICQLSTMKHIWETFLKMILYISIATPKSFMMIMMN